MREIASPAVVNPSPPVPAKSLPLNNSGQFKTSSLFSAIVRQQACNSQSLNTFKILPLVSAFSHMPASNGFGHEWHDDGESFVLNWWFGLSQQARSACPMECWCHVQETEVGPSGAETITMYLVPEWVYLPRACRWIRCLVCDSLNMVVIERWLVPSKVLEIRSWFWKNIFDKRMAILGRRQIF